MGRVKIAVDRNAPLEAATSAGRSLVERGRRAAVKAGIPAFVFWLLVYRIVLEFGSWGVFSRTKVFLTVGFVAFLVWAWDRIPRHPIVWAQLLFFAWSVQGILTADNNFWAYMTAKEVYANTVVALAIALLFAQPGRLATGIWAWVAVMAYGAFFALTHGGEGMGGGLGDPNENSMAMSSAFAVAYCGFEHLKGWRRWLSGALAILFAVTVVASFSRGGFIGLAAVFLYFVYSSRRKLMNLGLVMLGAVALLIFAPASYIEEIASISRTDEGTANSRQFLWHTAFNMWLANPIMGVGGGGVRFQIPDYIPEDFEAADPEQAEKFYTETHRYAGRSTHSLYFQLLPEQGAIGLGIWGFMVFAHFRTLSRLRRRVRSRPRAAPDLVRRTDLYARGLGGAMIGYLAGGAFVSVGYYSFAWYFSAMAVAIDSSLRRELRGSRM